MRSRRSASKSILQIKLLFQPCPALVFRDLRASSHCDLAELAGSEHVTMHMSCTGRMEATFSAFIRKEAGQLAKTLGRCTGC